ncbi:helix-turn-helix domain-containing protein [Paucibacter sp. DJ2R-2]|uniref:helix-turn-helix domain-containing protein n=1 Tax=Paucibacter sp. DJ2R-2 TaxID=2893558 RepID=UPI0021E5107E|nr:helix-turn-helix domain-containing protein [Paucibacter sp. DJ2R-2]MCV2422384.1 helix-turn-helix domain-containing protein [Paucibacter sp. DJ4R-1]MCV2440464.1 helix-turn-helix domain-containing protein [Paucibacter sp. DJ2R-2]
MSSILSEAGLGSGAAAPRQTAGAWLREARQQRGLHIVALAAMLKVPQAKLEALEADRWQELPDTTFVRALAKAICRVLNVDAAPVLALLPSSEDRELTMSRGLNQPFRDRSSGDAGFSLALVQRPVVWGPALLLAAAAAVYLMPAGWLPSGGGVGSSTAEPVEATPTLMPPSALEATQQSASASASASTASLPASAPTAALLSLPVASAVPLPSALSAAPTPAPLPNAAAPTRPVAAAPEALPVAAPAPGSVPLQVKVSSESWVEVVDSSGRTLLSKLLRPGDAQTLQGLPPLRVRVGNVAGTELILRGEPVDLLGRSKDNVARLELN